MSLNTNPITTPKYILYSLIAVVTTFLLHELSHWVTGELLGYKMGMSLNKAYPVAGAYRQEGHYTIISAVGPLVTLLQGFVAFLLIRTTSRKYLYPFLFAAFYVELLSGIMNFSRANDLGRISRSFNLGLLTIPVIFVCIHLLLVYKTSVREKYSLRFNGLTALWIILFSSAWILANQKFNIVLL